MVLVFYRVLPGLLLSLILLFVFYPPFLFLLLLPLFVSVLLILSSSTSIIKEQVVERDPDLTTTRRKAQVSVTRLRGITSRPCSPGVAPAL